MFSHIEIRPPYAESGTDVPGTLPAGIFVDVLANGSRVVVVKLPGDDDKEVPRFVTQDDEGNWVVGAPVEEGVQGIPEPNRSDFLEALEAEPMNFEGFLQAIEGQEAVGISPFG